MQQSRVSIHEPRRIVRRKENTLGNWEPVAVARFLWPTNLREQLESGKPVVFDGYDWKRVESYPVQS